MQINIESAKAVVKKHKCECNGRFSEIITAKITVAESVLKDAKVKDAQVEMMNRTLEYAISLVEKV